MSPSHNSDNDKKRGENALLRHVVLNDRSARTSTEPSITIKRQDFVRSRTTLETLQILASSNVTCIGDYAFQSCTSLQSVHLSESITSIGEAAFRSCTSLQSISIPKSIFSIGDSAFCGCRRLQSISITEDLAFIELGVFDGCDTLNQRHPNGRNYHIHTETWLRQRFNDLPIHQACYHYGNDTQCLSTLIDANKESLAATDTDAMGMTALHILCCNPHATVKSVQAIVEHDCSALSVQDVTLSTPLKLFLECRGLLGVVDEDNTCNEIDDDTDTEQEPLSMPSLCDLLRKGIKNEDLGIALILSRDLQAEVSNPDGNTGLTPFMSAATFPESGLDVVYALALKNVNMLA